MFRSCLSCIPMRCFLGAVANDDEIATTAQIGIYNLEKNEPFKKNYNEDGYKEEFQQNNPQKDENNKAIAQDANSANLGIINPPQLFILPQLAKDDGVTPINFDSTQDAHSINIASVQNAGSAINLLQLLPLPQRVKNDEPIVFSSSPSSIISGALGHKNNTNTLGEKLPRVLKVRPLERGENMLGREFFN